ncbi:hypothetical protein NQ314_019007 [Rhamnusium bicolor]|uniref:G-protein coupled receptors family 2 profile 2 domain-containing protein n=1 Tax=Rhamnusium bicolor TaxID=1586634 RepID=A0AAV8WPG5_9CUCU|nr:hypothetical protein NQ314_019007 [Rhamnusium bicolor]
MATISFLSNKNCSDGRSIKKLACDIKVMMSANSSDMTVDDKENLVFENDEILTPDQYCFTRMQKSDSDVFIVCYEEEHHWENIMMINVILSCISVIFIILTIAVYLSMPQLLDLQGICLVHSISGLAFSFIILGIIDLSYFISHDQCQLLAYLMYISFMYAFFWLNILCFHLWRVIVKPNILRFIKHWLFVYHIFGMGGPLLLLTFVLLANYSGFNYFENIHPGIGEVKCWFKSSTVTFIYFYGPISILLCINIIYFIWTTIVLWKQLKNSSEKKAKVLKFRVVPDALNALQGFLIFLILVVFRKKVVRALANKTIFRAVRLPASWKHAQDDECEELEEEISLSGVDEKIDILN